MREKKQNHSPNPHKALREVEESTLRGVVGGDPGDGFVEEDLPAGCFVPPGDSVDFPVIVKRPRR
jgi:hypothetical protein